MIRKIFVTIVALLITVAFIGIGNAQAQTASATAGTPEVKIADDWALVGTRVVDYTIDRDVVSFDKKDTFTSLKFKVKNGPINLHKGTVHYTNGETQDVTFAPYGSEGHLVDLKGNQRSIEKVTFWYDTKNSSDKRAVVEVWGKK